MKKVYATALIFVSILIIAPMSATAESDLLRPDSPNYKRTSEFVLEEPPYDWDDEDGPFEGGLDDDMDWIYLEMAVFTGMFEILDIADFIHDYRAGNINLNTLIIYLGSVTGGASLIVLYLLEAYDITNWDGDNM